MGKRLVSPAWVAGDSSAWTAAVAPLFFSGVSIRGYRIFSKVVVSMSPNPTIHRFGAVAAGMLAAPDFIPDFAWKKIRIPMAANSGILSPENEKRRVIAIRLAEPRL